MNVTYEVHSDMKLLRIYTCIVPKRLYLLLYWCKVVDDSWRLDVY